MADETRKEVRRYLNSLPALIHAEQPGPDAGAFSASKGRKAPHASIYLMVGAWLAAMHGQQGPHLQRKAPEHYISHHLRDMAHYMAAQNEPGAAAVAEKLPWRCCPKEDWVSRADISAVPRLQTARSGHHAPGPVVRAFFHGYESDFGAVDRKPAPGCRIGQKQIGRARQTQTKIKIALTSRQPGDDRRTASKDHRHGMLPPFGNRWAPAASSGTEMPQLLELTLRTGSTCSNSSA